MKARQIRVISSGGDRTLETSPQLDADRTPLLVYGHNQSHGRGWTLWYHEKGARPARVADYFIPGDRSDIELAEKWARGWLALHFGDWSWRSARVFRESSGWRSRPPGDGGSALASADGPHVRDRLSKPRTNNRHTNGAKVTENRLRRAATRSGYRLTKSRRKDVQAKDRGGYLIVDARTGSIVAGDLAEGGMSLDEVERWLRSNWGRTGGKGRMELAVGRHRPPTVNAGGSR